MADRLRAITYEANAVRRGEVISHSTRRKKEVDKYIAYIETKLTTIIDEDLEDYALLGMSKIELPIPSWLLCQCDEYEKEARLAFYNKNITVKGVNITAKRNSIVFSWEENVPQ